MNSIEGILTFISPIEQNFMQLFKNIFSLLIHLINNSREFFIVLVLTVLIYFCIRLSGAYSCGEFMYIPALRRFFLLKWLQQLYKTSIKYEDSYVETICKNLDRVKQNYIITPHHHGLYCLGTILGFLSQQEIPQERLFVGAASLMMRIPILGDISKMGGAFEISRKNIVRHLERNEHVLIFPGGVRDMIRCDFYTFDMNFEKRDGILEIAWAMKKPVIPLYIKGANQIFHVRKVEPLSTFLYPYLRYYFPIMVWGPTILELTNYVLSPIEPSRYKTYTEFYNEYYKKLFYSILEHEESRISQNVRNKMESVGISIDEQKKFLKL